MKKSVFISMIDYINNIVKKGSLSLKKFEKTWVGKNDFVNLTLEESEYKLNNMDDVFLESLSVNIDSANKMLENGYVVPEKIKKALLGNMIMRVCFVAEEDKKKYFNNLITNSSTANLSTADSEIRVLSNFYVNSNLIDDMFIKYFVNVKEKVMMNKDFSKFLHNLTIFDITVDGETFYKNRSYYNAVKQALDKKLLDPVSVIKDYKKILNHAVVIVLLECKNEVIPFVSKELNNDLISYLNFIKRSRDLNKRRTRNGIPDGTFLIKDIENLLSEINDNRLNQALTELKDIKLTNAIKEKDFRIIGKEFNSQKIDDVLEKTSDILNKLSVQELCNEDKHNKNNVVKNIEDVLLNNLSLKELQRNEYSNDELEDQLSKLLNQLTDIYKLIVEKDLRTLNKNLELRKIKI